MHGLEEEGHLHLEDRLTISQRLRERNWADLATGDGRFRLVGTKADISGYPAFDSTRLVACHSWNFGIVESFDHYAII